MGGYKGENASLGTSIGGFKYASIDRNSESENNNLYIEMGILE